MTLYSHARSVVIIASPKVRRYIMNARNRLVPSKIAHQVSDSLDIGDWWLMYMLGRNLEPTIYRDVMVQLAKDDEDTEVTKKRRL